MTTPTPAGLVDLRTNGLYPSIVKSTGPNNRMKTRSQRVRNVGP